MNIRLIYLIFASFSTSSLTGGVDRLSRPIVKSSGQLRQLRLHHQPTKLHQTPVSHLVQLLSSRLTPCRPLILSSSLLKQPLFHL